jgi:hypothetical protein
MEMAEPGNPQSWSGGDAAHFCMPRFEPGGSPEALVGRQLLL